jgi:hypothetical protein
MYLDFSFKFIKNPQKIKGIDRKFNRYSNAKNPQNQRRESRF